MNHIIESIITCGNENKWLFSEEGIRFEPLGCAFSDELHQICLYEDMEFQTMIGFGGAFTDAAATVFAGLSESEQERFIDSCFDDHHGLGYTFCRTCINSSDFARKTYSYDDIADDYELTHFTIAHDRKAIIPMIHKVQAKAPKIKLCASPWSPPAWMKDNHSMNGGGALKVGYSLVWAHYIARYLSAYGQEGIAFWGITVQNEPYMEQRWESCVFSAEQEANFIADALGPVLTQEKLGDLKILFWDYNRHMALQRVRTVLKNEQARAYIYGMAVHWYSGDHFEAFDYIRQRYGNLPIINTEACKMFGSDPYEIAESYAHDIIGCLNHHVSGWIDWNLLLDDRGGPNHADNYCHSPIHVKNNRICFQPSYYYITHISRYIRPGAVRIGVSRYTDDIDCTAARNSDGKYVVVLLNRTDQAQVTVLNCRYGTHTMTLPPRSICTLLY